MLKSVSQDFNSGVLQFSLIIFFIYLICSIVLFNLKKSILAVELIADWFVMVIPNSVVSGVNRLKVAGSQW